MVLLLAVFISRSEIADKYTRPGASTLGGNSVSSTAGIAVLDYIEEHNLVEKSRVRGKQLKRWIDCSSRKISIYR